MKKIKKLIMLIFAGVLVFSTATMVSANERAAINHAGGSPVYINYQGELTDGGGQPFANVALDMAFELFQSETGGVFDWKETHISVQTDAEGRFNVILNSTGTAAGDLASLVQGNSELWLQLTIDGETLSPRQRLTSAAYALSAPWSGISGIPSGFSDGTDDVGIAGTGMISTGTILSVSPAYRLPQNCTNGQIAEWDNTNNVWGCADVTGGSGSAYTAGSGLVLNNGQFSINYANNNLGNALFGTANTPARSDHTHITQAWDAATSNGLSVSTDNTATGAFALKGISTAITGIGSGVYGQSSSPNGYGVYGKNATTGYGVYSDGNAKVVGDLTVTGTLTVGTPTTTTRTDYYTVSLFEFVNIWDHSFTIDNDNRLYADRVAGGKGTIFLAPIHLPHGAKLEELKVIYSNNVPAEGADVFLKRANFTTSVTGSEILAAVDYSNQNRSFYEDTSQISDPSGVYYTVDNTKYSYFIQWQTFRDNAIQLHGVYIKYSITTP